MQHAAAGAKPDSSRHACHLASPLLQVEGMHVITVEGIGNTRDGLHPVQVCAAAGQSSTTCCCRCCASCCASCQRCSAAVLGGRAFPPPLVPSSHLCCLQAALLGALSPNGAISGPCVQPPPAQERLAKAHGSQCGFCTPGFVMSMVALLRSKAPQVRCLCAGMCAAWIPVSFWLQVSARPGLTIAAAMKRWAAAIHLCTGAHRGGD